MIELVPDDLRAEAKAALARWWQDKINESFLRQAMRPPRERWKIHLPWWGGFKSPRGYSRAAIRWRRRWRRDQ